MTEPRQTGCVSFAFDADGYTALDLFAERVEGSEAPNVRLTDSCGLVSEQTMDADLYRQRITIALNPAERYTVEATAMTAPYVYLCGGDNLLDRGIRVINADTGAITAGTGAFGELAPCRAAAHYEPPEHWMNDPNGLCRFQGRYHLYYQFNPYGWQWSNMHWGHAVSKDLVHWTHLPVFLEPQRELNADRGLSGGAFSGSAIPVDADGHPCPGDKAAAIRFYLTRHWATVDDPDSTTEYQSTLLSTDSLTPGPETRIIDYPDSSVGFDFRDPKIDTGFDGGAMIVTGTFLTNEAAGVTASTDSASVGLDTADVQPQPGVSTDFDDGGWFTTDARGTAGQQPDMEHIPAIVAFRNTTPDLRNDAWQYVGPVLVDKGYHIGRTVECPDAFPLDGSDVVIGAIMHIRTQTGTFQPIRWYVGSVDNDRLSVQNSGWVDFGNCYYAVQSFRDDNGRRIAIGWLADWFGVRREAPGRANGAMSLPRELHVRNGKLYSRPVSEVYDALGDCVTGADGVWQLSNNAYYADIRPCGDTSVTLCDTGSGAWHMEIRNGVVRCTNTGMGCGDDVSCVAEVAEVHRVEVFYDRGIIEVFVNDGEAAGAMLAYDPRNTGELRVTGNYTCEVRQFGC